MRRIPRSLGRALLVAALLGPLPACSGRSPTGALTPPPDAAPWENDLATAFDDDFTAIAPELKGRAPSNVLDQRLLAQRLGFADVVAVARIEQIFTRKRRGRIEPFVAVEIEELLIGKLVPGTESQQLLRLSGDEEIDPSLHGRRVLLFVRWAPEATPPYHHHVMVAEPAVMEFVTALVQHAKKAGVLTPGGGVKKNRATRSSRNEPELP